VRSVNRVRAVQRAYAALALWGGPPLASDRYADWARDIRDQLDHGYLSLLDLISADAARHGSHQEAATAITAALVQAPHDSERYYDLAEHLIALGRHATAQHLARLAGVELADRDD
jgi:two-component SAPR family response regulator